jgi:hypothetical protein
VYHSHIEPTGIAAKTCALFFSYFLFAMDVVDKKKDFCIHVHFAVLGNRVSASSISLSLSLSLSHTHTHTHTHYNVNAKQVRNSSVGRIAAQETAPQRELH